MDIGANLTDKQFHADLDKVVDNAFKEDIVSIVLTGTSVKGSWNAIQTVNKYKKYLNRLYCTVGIHPHDAKNYNTEEHDKLDKYLTFKEVVAVGECGLDFNRNFSSYEDQLRCFRGQIDLALKYKLPLFVHERDAFDKLVEIFDEYMPQLQAKNINVVIHCFTGTAYQVKEYIKRGFYIGITGWITDKRRNANLVDALEHIPLDKLMVETDSPYLTPKKAHKRRNEPQFLKYVIEEIAKIRKESEEIIRKITIDNTINFFKLPEHIRSPICEDNVEHVQAKAMNVPKHLIQNNNTNMHNELVSAKSLTQSKPPFQQTPRRLFKQLPEQKMQEEELFVQDSRYPKAFDSAHKNTFDIKSDLEFPSLK